MLSDTNSLQERKRNVLGRPKKYNIDTDQVEKLAGLGCTNVEIASFFDVGEHVIRKTYAGSIAKGKENGKIRLRQWQMKAAQKGNVAMLIWLGKQILGQAEKQEVMTGELPSGFNTEVI